MHANILFSLLKHSICLHQFIFSVLVSLFKNTINSSQMNNYNPNKDKEKDIVIAGGGGVGDAESPIETCWHFPSSEEEKASKSSPKKSRFSLPLKFRDSLKSLQMVLEGPHEPKDEHQVNSFREKLFLDGLLPAKHNDYHTLLRYVVR